MCKVSAGGEREDALLSKGEGGFSAYMKEIVRLITTGRLTFRATGAENVHMLVGNDISCRNR